MKRPNMCAIAGVVFLLIGFSPHARSACINPNSVLNATYGWEIEEGLFAAGVTPGPSIGDFFPFATTGHLTFDGSGNISGAHDTNFAGIITHHVDSGTYSVNSDCTTGSISIPSDGLTLNILVVSGGQEVKLTSATRGRVFSGTLQIMAAPTCSATTLSGASYGYATHGLVAAALVGAGFPRIGGFVPFSNSGEVAFKADGSVSGIDNVNLGGVFIPGLPIAGTYSVNSDCTGTTTMTIAGIDHSWNFVILQGAGQVIFVTTPSGFVWSGTLTKQ